MTTMTPWGGQRGLVLVLSGVGLALTRCGSAPVDYFGEPGVNAAGKGGASVSSAGSSANARAGSVGVDAAGAAGLTGNESYEFVFDSQILPTSGNDYALDLDGDGGPNNAYGGVISALTSYGFDAQTAADAELAAGRGLQLLALGVPRANSAPSSATLELWRAQDQAAPDFAGAGSFVIDSGVPSARLDAILNGRELKSVRAAAGETLPRLLLHLPLGGALDLPVSVCSISFEFAGTRLIGGQLNAAALASDVDAIVPPALAAEFDRRCTGANVQSESCQTVLTLFDSNQDRHISADELRTSSPVKALLAPDVKLFDAQAKFAPDSAAKVKDALSIGFGFTAVAAQIKQPP
ncbi:MAG TPA: hypothetical protein VFK05_31375 [Polyangiaceae bacterium]|nr:hypothetical protein [Polyangiaceae bacterium]